MGYNWYEVEIAIGAITIFALVQAWQSHKRDRRMEAAAMRLAAATWERKS